MPSLEVPQWLERSKAVAETSEAIVTAIGIFAAALWFYLRRLRFPRADIEQRVAHRRLQNGRIWLRLSVTIKNVGDVLIKLASSCVVIQQVKPELPLVVGDHNPVPEGECEIPWPCIEERNHDWTGHEVEPGETGEYHFDFVIDREITEVQIYTYFENRRKWFKKIGWNLTTLHELNKE